MALEGRPKRNEQKERSETWSTYAENTGSLGVVKMQCAIKKTDNVRVVDKNPESKGDGSGELGEMVKQWGR